MGFLKDLAALTAAGNAARDRFDVGASLEAASRSMDQASRALAAAVPPADDELLESVRVRTTASVVAARQLPMMLGMHSLVEVDLVVMMPSGLPLPVSRIEQVAPLHLARLAPGATLDVSLVPGRPDSVRVEWNG